MRSDFTMAENMNLTTMITTRNLINGSIAMNCKPEVLSSYTHRVYTRRPTYWDFQPGYRAVSSPGLQPYQDSSKVAKPWPPAIPPGVGDRRVGHQVEFVKSWLPAIPPGFELQDKSGSSSPPAILRGFENLYIERQDKFQSTAIKDGPIDDVEETLFLPSWAKIAGNATEASPSANDQNPYNIERWWIRGERKEKEKGDTFREVSSVHSSDLSEDKAYSHITQLHHPRPQRSTSAEVMGLELQARLQTPFLNFAATPPLDCADEVRPCVRSSRILLDRLRARLEDAKKATVQKQQVDVIDLSEEIALKNSKNMIPNDSYVNPIDNSVTREPQVDLLSSFPSPRLEAPDSNNNTNSNIGLCEYQVDLISFGISTEPPHTRMTIPRYQQTDLLSMDSSPLLRFEANLTPEEKLTTLNFRTNDRGTSFINQSPQNTPLKQALTWGLLFLFFVGLARLISKAEGLGLWMLVLALGLGAGNLTRVR